MLGANQKPRANKRVKSKLNFCLPNMRQFKRKTTFNPKPLASWLPLKSFVSPLASPWLPFVRSQWEAKPCLTQDLKFSRPRFLHLHMQFLILFYPLKVCFHFKIIGFLTSTKTYCLTFGFPLASHCCKPTRSQSRLLFCKVCSLLEWCFIISVDTCWDWFQRTYVKSIH